MINEAIEDAETQTGILSDVTEFQQKMVKWQCAFSDLEEPAEEMNWQDVAQEYIDLAEGKVEIPISEKNPYEYIHFRSYVSEAMAEGLAKTKLRWVEEAKIDTFEPEITPEDEEQEIEAEAKFQAFVEINGDAKLKLIDEQKERLYWVQVMMWSKEGRDLVLDHDSSDWRKVDGSDGKILAALKEKEDWSDTEFEDLYSGDGEEKFNIKILETTEWQDNKAILEFKDLKDYWNKPELFHFQENTRNNLYVFPILIDKEEKKILAMPETKELEQYAVEVEKICPCMRSNPLGIYAIADGKVEEIRTKSRGYGLHIFLRHDDDSCSMYAHLSSGLIRVGQQVKAGEQIGVMGNSGTKYIHLHLSYIPSINDILNADGKIESRDTPIVNASSNPLFLINKDGNSYPTNTNVTGGYNQDYTSVSVTYKTKHIHEGIDFSGRTENLLPNWKFGIKGEYIEETKAKNYRSTKKITFGERFQK